MKHLLIIFILLLNCLLLNAQEKSEPLVFWGKIGIKGSLNQPVTSLSSANHNIAVKADGKLVGWGYNADGQVNIPKDLSNVKAVACGTFHSIALKEDGTLVGWGTPRQSKIPVGLPKIKAIAAGLAHTLALAENGKVYAWGDTTYGACNVPADLTDIKDIAAGSQYSIALKTDGTVITWGLKEWEVPEAFNGIKAIASKGSVSLSLKENGTVVPFGFNSTGVLTIPDNLKNVKAISVGGGHAVALKENGTLVTWGDNSYGQLDIPSGLGKVKSVEAGYNHTTVILENGNLVSWGLSEHGQAVLPPVMEDINSVSLGSSLILALKRNGKVLAWGTNFSGESNVPKGLEKVIAVSAGYLCGLALKQDGTLSAWGRNDYGQLSIPAGLSDIKQVKTCMTHTAALKDNGQVIVWGDNQYGQTNVPLDLDSVISIAVGFGHTLALGANGTVRAWGKSNHSQDKVPEGLKNVKAIAAREDFSLALKTDGTVVAWGKYLTSVLDTIKNIRDISAGYSFINLLKEDGTIICFGNSFDYGEQNIPQGLKNIKSISSGDMFSTALLYSHDSANVLSGNVFADINRNCLKESGERGIQNFIIKAEKGSEVAYSSSDIKGHYIFDDLDTGKYKITIERPLFKGSTLIHAPFCDSSAQVIFPAFGSNKTFDAGYNVTFCPALEINIVSTRRRRCAKGTATVSYCNRGFESSPATYVTVVYPSFLKLISASKSYTSVQTIAGSASMSLGTGEKGFLFNVGELKSGQCDNIQITDSVICGIEEIRGSTICTQAHISGTGPCQTVPESHQLNVYSGCKGNQLVHVVKNNGADMSDSSSFEILLNNKLALSKKLKIASLDSIIVYYSSTGSYTYTFQSEDLPNPLVGKVIYSTEGNACKQIFWKDQGYELSKGYILQLPDYSSLKSASNCLPIVDSYDPNDKSVFPAGIYADGNAGLIEADQKLTYTVRFENTGSDTAYQVIVKDILNENLELRSLSMLSSSHPYTYSITGINKPELKIVFDHINLLPKKVDSTRSGGYIQFSISPKSDLPLKTTIRNWAGIYFDYNSPIFTNEVSNTTWKTFRNIDPALKNLVKVIENNSVLGTSSLHEVSELNIYPNPTSGLLQVNCKGKSVINIYNSLGYLMYSKESEGQTEVNLMGQSSGIYLIEIINNDGRINKIVEKF